MCSKITTNIFDSPRWPWPLTLLDLPTKWRDYRSITNLGKQRKSEWEGNEITTPIERQGGLKSQNIEIDLEFVYKKILTSPHVRRNWKQSTCPPPPKKLKNRTLQSVTKRLSIPKPEIKAETGGKWVPWNQMKILMGAEQCGNQPAYLTLWWNTKQTQNLKEIHKSL